MAEDKVKTAPVQAQLTALGLQIDAIVEHLATVPRIGRPPTFGDCAKGCPPGGCTEGSVYGYQMGCRGDACRAANTEYYGAWRKSEPTTPAVKDVGKEVAAKAAPRAKAKPKVESSASNGSTPKPVVKKAVAKKVVAKKVGAR